MIGAGKSIRWSRLVDPTTGRGLIVPIDHGLTMGPIRGLRSTSDVAKWIRHPAINGIIAHKGTVERLGGANLLGNLGIVVHLNGMTVIGEKPDNKQMLSSVHSAVRLGADAVSLQVNFSGTNHAHNLRMLADVEESASNYGLLVLAMVYDMTEATDDAERVTRQRHLIRAAIELGVDIVKTDPPPRPQDLPDLLDGISEDVAIFFSGGALRAEDELTDLARFVATSNAKGLCVGRNVFQRPDADSILSRLRAGLDAAPATPLPKPAPFLGAASTAGGHGQ